MARTPYWEDTSVLSVIVDNGDALLSLVGGLSEDERRGMTIVRTIVALSLSPQTTSGVVGSMMCDIAIGAANQQAFTAGVASLPDPAINSERPPRGWLYKTRAAILDDADNASPLTEVRADVRSKRKIDAGIAYLHLAVDARTGTAFSVTVSGLVRILYLMA